MLFLLDKPFAMDVSIIHHWFRAGIRPGCVEYMMTSSNGNIFRVTGHLCGEFIRSPVNSQHKGQWRGALMFSLICVWIKDWVNNHEAGDLRRYRAHYDVIVMLCTKREHKANFFRYLDMYSDISWPPPPPPPFVGDAVANYIFSPHSWTPRASYHADCKIVIHHTSWGRKVTGFMMMRSIAAVSVFTHLDGVWTLWIRVHSLAWPITGAV